VVKRGTGWHLSEKHILVDGEQMAGVSQREWDIRIAESFFCYTDRIEGPVGSSTVERTKNRRPSGAHRQLAGLSGILSEGCS